MMRSLRYWRRILVANLAATIAVVGIEGGFGPGVSGRAVLVDVGITFVYAMSIGTLMGVGLPWVGGRCWHRGSPVNWSAMLGAMVALTVAGTLIANGLLTAAGVLSGGRFWPRFLGSLEIALVISLVIGTAVTVYEVARSELERTALALRTKERDEAEAQRLAVEAQLASLESRVQPHFLFNTLNSIAALIPQDPAGAERMTEQLASLMRSALDGGSAPLVPLEQELRVVRDYLDIEHVRFEDRLRYRIEADPSDAATSVPRLSLQTLVENSVKYAVSPRRDGGSIVVRAAAAGGRVTLAVEDDGPGFDAAATPGGHGLALLRARLSMLYGGDASLEIDSRPGRTCIAIDVPQHAHSAPGTEHPAPST